VDDPQWQSSFEKVYTASSLQVPWHVVLGNHDYHHDPDAQIAYARPASLEHAGALLHRTERIDPPPRWIFSSSYHAH